MKIGFQLIIPFIIISLAITLTGYSYVILMENTFEEKLGNGATLLAVETMRETDHKIHDRIMELSSFISDTSISRFVVESNYEFQNIDDVESHINKIDKDWIDGENTPEIESILTNELSELLKKKLVNYYNAHGYYIFPEIFVMNEYGVIVGSSGRTTDYRQSDDEWYPKDITSEKFWVYDVEYDETADAIVTGVVLPILHDEKVVGLLKGYIDMNSDVIELIDYMESTSPYENIKVNIVDKNGYSVISRQDVVSIVDQELDQFGTLSPAFALIKDSNPTTDIGYVTGDVNGEPILSAYALSNGYMHYEGLEWCAIINYDRNVLFAPIFNLKQTLLALSLMITCIGGFSGFLITRRISKPIEQLEDVTEKMASGNLNVLVPIEGTDEHKSLAKSFNKMANSIRQADDVINKQVIELQKLDKQKSEFSAMVSHELKTPIHPILGYCELLLRKLTDENDALEIEMIKKIQKNAKNLDVLINRIFLAQKIELQNIKLNIKEFNVLELLEQIKNDVIVSTKKKNIQFNINCKKTVSIYGDIEKIHEVFINLIQNSVDFVESNSGKIEIGVQMEENDVICYVKDNGIGIPKEHHANLFQKYFQIDTSITREHGGSGLGLSICKGLIESMKGKIWVKSSPDIGSTFFFSIPMK